MAVPNHTCYLCGAMHFKRRPGRVRDRQELAVLECLRCGLVFLSSFEHVNDKFYQESGMVNGNMDIRSRLNETEADDERRYQFMAKMAENKSILDFGCGNGGFLLNIKNVARKAVGVELEECLQPHYVQNGLKVYPAFDQVTGCYDLITLFHVLEHLPDPCKMLGALADKLTEQGRIIIEVPNADDVLLSLYGSEPFANFTYWSCHLFLYNSATLALLAQKAGLQVEYIKQVQRYPLSNHLHWLAAGKPGGHKVWSFIDSAALHDAYEKQLASLGRCDTIIASLRR